MWQSGTVSPQCHSPGLGRERQCPLRATAWAGKGSGSHSPPGLVMALAGSARSAPGLGAFGGFESQSAELFLRTNQRRKAALGRDREAGKNRLHSATAVLPSCSGNRGVSTVCKLLGQSPVTRRTGHGIRESLPQLLSPLSRTCRTPPTSQLGPVTRG